MSISLNRRRASLEKEKWAWSTPDNLRDSWIQQLPDKNADPRVIWVDELLDRSSRVLDKRNEAARNTERSHWFQRASAGASAAVAALTRIRE